MTIRRNKFGRTGLPLNLRLASDIDEEDEKKDRGA
jgi:hypothetical protein